MGLFDEYANGTWTREEPAQAPPRDQSRTVPLLTVRPRNAEPPVVADPGEGESWSPNDPAPAPRPRLPPGQLPPGFVPKGELKPSDLSWTDTAKSKAQDVLMAAGMNPWNARHLGHGAVDIANTLTPMGSVFGLADLTYNLPRGRYVASGFDALAALPLVGQARRAAGLARAPERIPAHEPPQWMTQGGPPASVAGPPRPDTMGFVTPSVPELVGTGRVGMPLGSAQQGYNAINNSPVRYHPHAGHDLAALATQLIERPAQGGFTRQKAPLVYETLDNFARQTAAEGRLLTPSDFDTLRQQLRGLPDANGPAGERVVNFLDTYMLSPNTGRIVQGTPQDLAQMRQNFLQARGDYRSGKTAETVEGAIDRAGTRAGSTYSGMNLDNATRQNMAAFSTTDAGADRIFGATQPERLRIWDASQGDWRANAERRWANRLGGGGGLGQAVTTGGVTGGVSAAAGHMLGIDPITAGTAGMAAGVAAANLGTALKRSSNERTVQAAEDAAAYIRRNSPEYARRAALPENAPIVDPLWRRQAITNAIAARAAREPAQDWWSGVYTPYQYRDQE